MNAWKYPLLLILGIGVSYLGNWIYLVAINLYILNLTGSAAAVAGLYVIKPIATILTNTWSGSVIDRVNKRKLLVSVDIIRGGLVLTLPFIENIWGIYSVVFIISLVGSFFGPTSQVYITRLVPEERRQRFNSMMGTMSSGAFLLGPALSGVLIMYYGTDLSIFINAVTFIICGIIILCLPNVDQTTEKESTTNHLQNWLNDWKVVVSFFKQAHFFVAVYLMFQLTMLIGFALDSQEVTFIKQDLGLSDEYYGLLISITGAGSIVGALVATMLAKKVELCYYIGGGMLLSSVGYVLFYSSFNFISALVSFIILGFFMAFANAGYTTFFQNQVPVNIMGRIGSVASIIQSIFQIVFTLMLGFFAELFPLQTVTIIGSILGLSLSISLVVYLFRKRQQVSHS
ncbi:MFS transporter [Tenuibacillus multivorans]|uniref:Predicted arabinose efflux permease, MFS family n=1 Tax=Tenuibacillus multivorans TaxID=237069 RepID=A0A1H0DDG0_9BACI|nr:MFS transporter [Tenuibacillus multivorans]GEL76604.1 MFS transporter [Tenuibacillus multivorans]SDN68029.1 Predicted arabinose efflux permease, MFS family [Tenuibacillus multivorans]